MIKYIMGSIIIVLIVVYWARWLYEMWGEQYD